MLGTSLQRVGRHLFLYLILPSLLHEYAVSESRTPGILDIMLTYRPFRDLEFLGLRASSLVLPIAIIDGALFFFPFTPSSCLAVFSTDSFIQGVHQNETSDSRLYVTDLSRTHTALNIVDSGLRHEHEHEHKHEHDQCQEHQPLHTDSPYLARVSFS
jgi:hypothetical protein